MEFRDVKGKKIECPKDNDYLFRPAAYGILIKEKKLLLIKPNWDEKKYCLPGGSIEKGETIKESLIREFLEETSYKIKVDEKPLFVDTQPFGNKEKDIYFQRINLYFKVSLVSKTNKQLDSETVEIVWKNFYNIKPLIFTYFQRKFIKKMIAKK